MSKAMRASALVWLLLVLAVAGWAAAAWPDWQARIDMDLFALLPHDERDARAEAALQALARQGERQLVLLVGHREPAEARRAAALLAERLQPLPLRAQAQGAALDALRAAYLPHRAGLVSRADRSWLADADDTALLARARAEAFAPFSASGLAWRDDPLGLFGRWLAELAGASPLRPDGEQLALTAAGRHYVLLAYTLQGSAFSLADAQQVADGLARAQTALHATVPQAQVLRAGVVLHAAKAAEQARREVSAIGTGSLVGALALVVLVFGGARPLALMLLTLGVATLCAMALVFACYPRVHALTLVFGATLIGVAVDYGLHALAAGIEDDTPVPLRYRRLAPGLFLAMITTALAYGGLLLTPFPGLAQMALFAGGGIVAAWLTVVLWFPAIAPRRLRATRAARWLGHRRWPRWHTQPATLAIALLAAVLCTAGLARLQAEDNVRALTATDAGLLREHQAVAGLLGLPSPAQLFIVSGDTPEAVLARTARLGERLDALTRTGQLTGYDALTRWVPPPARQQADVALQARRLAALAPALRTEFGIAPPGAPATPLTVAGWLAQPAGAMLSHLWLGRGTDGRYAGVVLVKGIAGADTLPALAALAGPDVRWLDKPAEVSQLMGRYRVLLGWVLAAAYLACALALLPRYGRATWRVLLPPALASAATLGLLGLAGEPVQLLTLLALLLVLGVGVDYGIFHAEHPEDGRMQIATTLSAASTMLSFGLLAFSHTPALAAFGLATLLGVALAWLIAPWCRAPAGPAHHVEGAPW
ncbi:MMPL family transporter [Chitiniphilus purpureus]|uniref:MMPL family transporter n=1 Tax=Chitiniphilus purpureus TaxID=2981137 RepID=A0ABY6DR87_9NEIS|nr:MMPL family transporter [Chitiniphilus sp. CD1]UXY16001.1 MMPL family transporter [Chitiniphilus sp. CD1]